MCARPTGIKIIAKNRKVRHLYELLDFLEAGIVLMGSEVKSLRAGKISFMDGYVRITGGEAFLSGVHIATYSHAGYAQHQPDRERKLLLHKHEINNLQAKIEQRGLTIVPTQFYFKNGKVKVELALARGKKVYDRREDLKQQAIKRDLERELAG